MRLSHLLAVAGKEFRHILRDGQTLAIVLSLPVCMMFLFGYALKSEIENAPVVVIDPVPSPASARLISALSANRQFAVGASVREGNPAELLTRYRANAVLRLDPDFEKQTGKPPVRIGLWLDGSDPATATTLRNAFSLFLTGHLALETGKAPPEGLAVTTRFLYNPGQESSKFFVPGLMAAILAMVSALLTSITITREKERGTLANLRISRLTAAEIIGGKLLPYFGIAVLMGLFILGIGRLAFQVSIRGSVPFLALCTTVFLIANLSIGLLISTAVAREHHAMLLALGTTMMPTIMLSGFIFPLENMPLPLQYLASALPATWFLKIVRGVILKGAGLAELHLPLTVLCLLGGLLLLLSSVRFAREK